MTFIKIRTKLQLGFLTLSLLAMLAGGVTLYFLNQLTRFREQQQTVNELVIQALKTSKYERNFLRFDASNQAFMQSGNSENHRGFYQSLDSLEKLLQQFEQLGTDTQPVISREVTIIRQAVQQYRALFGIIAQVIRRKGFVDSGLEGEMRKAVHALENGGVADKTTILTLRRHEKDFLLRKNSRYVLKLHALADSLLPLLPQPADQQVLENYLSHFDAIVKLEEQLGFNPDQGLQGSLKAYMERIEPAVTRMRDRINLQTRQVLQWVYWAAGMGAVLFLGLAIGLGYYLSYQISKPIVLLNKTVRSVVEGHWDEEGCLDEIRSNDEIGFLAQNFKTMLNKLHENFDSVEAQNRQLQQVAQQENIRRWLSDGLALLGEKINYASQDPSEKCQQVLTGIIQYVQANQGSVYLLNEGTAPQLEQVASYAYGKKKYLKHTIALGQGLVGQTFLEGETIYLSEIPEDYLRITSGLGDAPPRYLLIVPIKNRQDGQGVLELASFTPFTPHQVELLEKLAGQLAVSLAADRINSKTHQLLLQSQVDTEQVRAQEEEMRQQLEELIAIQENSHRLQNDLLRKDTRISELEAEVARFREAVQHPR